MPLDQQPTGDIMSSIDSRQLISAGLVLVPLLLAGIAAGVTGLSKLEALEQSLQMQLKNIDADLSRTAKDVRDVETKVDAGRVQRSGLKEQIGIMKSELGGVQKDVERVRTDVKLTRSYMISTGRTVREIRTQLEDGGRPTSSINGEY